MAKALEESRLWRPWGGGKGGEGKGGEGKGGEGKGGEGKGGEGKGGREGGGREGGGKVASTESSGQKYGRFLFGPVSVLVLGYLLGGKLTWGASKGAPVSDGYLRGNQKDRTCFRRVCQSRILTPKNGGVPLGS